MPEIIPLHANLHYKCTFDIEGDSHMGATRKIVRSWVIQKVVEGLDELRQQEIESEIRQGWFFKGNAPEIPNYSWSGRQIRTACIPGEDIRHPVCWAFEMIHPDSEEPNRRWSIEITLKKQPSDSIRFATTIKHFATMHFMGPLPELPSASTPKFVGSILTSKSLKCKKGDSLIRPQATSVSSGVRALFDELKSPMRMLPYIFVSPFGIEDNSRFIDAESLAKNVRGNANVYVLKNQSVNDELNYYLGDNRDFHVLPGSVRTFFPRLDLSRPDNSRQHRYFSRSFIEENTEATVRQYITNGLSRFASTQPGDLLSFQDIFKERRKHKIMELAHSQRESSEMEELYNEELAKEERNSDDWKQLAESRDDENKQLLQEKEKLRFENNDLRQRVSETDQLRMQCEALHTQNTVLENFSKFPDSLEGVLLLAQKLFSSQLEIAPEAFTSAHEYFDRYNSHWKRIDNLNLAWAMVSDFAKILHSILFDLPDGGNPVQLLKERGSTFELALKEGKQTAKNKNLTRLRKISYDGQEIDITAHLKHGNSEPNLLRLHYFQDNQKKKLIIGHFGKHLDNASTRNQ